MKSERIADLYADAGPFASVYVEVSRDAQQGDRVAELQARAACDELLAQGAPVPVVDEVRDRLMQSTHLPAPVSRCVVASASGVLLDELTSRHRPQPTAGWAALPDIGEWLADEDSAVPFVLALADHEGGDVRTYRTNSFTPDEDSSVGGETEHEHKFHGGGWAHLRYQHNTENVWRRNAAEVAEEIQRQVSGGAELVLLAGDPQSCQQVRELLGDIRAELIQLKTGGRTADGGEDALEAAVDEALYGAVVSKKLADVHQLQERLGRDDSVPSVIDDLPDPFVRGLVHRLLIDPVRAREFELEPARHPGLALGAIGGLPAAIPADQALIAAAAVTAADVVVTRAGTLGGAPAAGLLRWN